MEAVMAKRAARKSKSTPAAPRGTTNRDKAIDALKAAAKIE